LYTEWSKTIKKKLQRIICMLQWVKKDFGMRVKVKRSMYGSLFFMTFVLLVVPGCDWHSKQTDVSAKEPMLRLIDVNTQEVYNDAHIRGAVHVDLESVEKESSQWNKKTPVVFYCSDYACMASHSAAEKLQTLGFEDVAVYPGGIQEWYSLSKESSEKYLLDGKAEMAFLRNEVRKVVPIKEGANVVSADQLAQRLDKMKQ